MVQKALAARIPCNDGDAIPERHHYGRNRQQYDVSSDARRFIMIRELADDARGEVVFMENWFEELKTKVKQ